MYGVTVVRSGTTDTLTSAVSGSTVNQMKIHDHTSQLRLVKNQLDKSISHSSQF